MQGVQARSGFKNCGEFVSTNGSYFLQLILGALANSNIKEVLLKYHIVLNISESKNMILINGEGESSRVGILAYVVGKQSKQPKCLKKR